MLVRVVEVLDMDEKLRRISEQDVRRMKDSGDVEGLIEALNYRGDGVVRRLAVRFLRELGDRRAVEPLIQVMNDKGSDIREWAAGALGKLGALRAFEPLLQALNDSERRMRESAAFALGELGDVRAVEHLIRALEEDVYFEVRWRAAEALGKLGDGRAVEHLVLLLREKDPRDEEGEVLKAAAEALDKLGWKPENDLDRVYYLMAKGEWEKLAKLGKVAVEPLLEALHYGWNYDLRVGAAKTLGMIGDQRAVEPLLEIVSEVEGLWGSGYRCAAAEALGKIGDRQTVEPLRRVLVNKEEYLLPVRLCVVKALDKLGWKPQNDVERVYFLVASDKWDKVVELNDAAIDTLIQFLVDRDDTGWDYQDVQLNVVKALFRIGGKRVIRSLAEVLKGINDSTVYAEAEYALERLQGGIRVREDGTYKEVWEWEDEDYEE